MNQTFRFFSLVLVCLASDLRSAEPRYLKSTEEARPILEQYSRDPFLYSGLWNLEEKKDLEPIVQKPKRLAEPSDLNSRKTEATNIGGHNPPTPAFLEKVSVLLPADRTVKPFLSTPVEEEVMNHKLKAMSASQGKPGVTRYLKPYLIMTASFLANIKSKGKVFPGECEIRYRSSNESQILLPNDELELKFRGKSDIKVGDLYKIYEVGPPYQSFRNANPLGRLVEIKGIVEVTRIGTDFAVARLTQCFGTISRSSRAAPFVNPESLMASSYTEITGSQRLAQLIWLTPPNQTPQPFSQAIIDGGTKEGFRVGDLVFLLDQQNGKLTDKVLGNALIIRVEDHSATVLLQDVNPGSIKPGDFALAHLSANP